MALYIFTVVFTAATFTIIPYHTSPCKDMPSQEYMDNVTGIRRFVQYGSCPDGTYNEMASLTLSSQEDVIKHLFSRDQYTFSLSVLFPYTILYATCFYSHGIVRSCRQLYPQCVDRSGDWEDIWGNCPNVDCRHRSLAPWSVCSRWSLSSVSVLDSRYSRHPCDHVRGNQRYIAGSADAPVQYAFPLFTNLFGMDGWTHANLHASTNLPHHRVRPHRWPDMDTMPDEERVAHPPSLHKLNKVGDRLDSDHSERFTAAAPRASDTAAYSMLHPSTNLDMAKATTEPYNLNSALM